MIHFLLVYGPTCSGKSTLISNYETRHWKQVASVRSSTTRHRRDGESRGAYDWTDIRSFPDIVFNEHEVFNFNEYAGAYYFVRPSHIYRAMLSFGTLYENKILFTITDINSIDKYKEELSRHLASVAKTACVEFEHDISSCLVLPKKLSSLEQYHHARELIGSARPREQMIAEWHQHLDFSNHNPDYVLYTDQMLQTDKIIQRILK